MDTRRKQLQQWLGTVFPGGFDLHALPTDASFRRYFRITSADQTWIAMDAPPDREPLHSYLACTRRFLQSHVAVPEIFHQDVAQGFLLLSDLGDRLLLRELTPKTADYLYQKSLDALLPIQQCQTDHLPRFDHAFMLSELRLFEYWFLEKLLDLSLDAKHLLMLENTFNYLLNAATAQPQICIHRDYHARNLLVREQDDIGIIDFQDAMQGPLLYDVASLLKDCYIAWPEEKITQWLAYYYEIASTQGVINNTDFAQCAQWLDLMGMQRHLKALFIFARKTVRDHNDRYLADVPRVLAYLQKVSQQYGALQDFSKFLETVILPAWQLTLSDVEVTI